MSIQTTLLTSFHPIKLLQKNFKSLLWLTAFNTAVALFITLVLNTRQTFLVNLFFSMLIGYSINIVIGVLRWIIWRDQKPNRFAFLLVCMIAAPIGYFIGGAIGMTIYGMKVPGFWSVMKSGEGILVIMSMFISLFVGVFFWNHA